MITVTKHARYQYLKRILDMRDNVEDKAMHNFAEVDILTTVVNPDTVLHQEEDMPQVHIRGEVAAIVGKSIPEDPELKPYDSLEDDIYIPTVYDKATFTEENNARRVKRNA